jgi:PhzF family phenazine biosynthesis protein
MDLIAGLIDVFADTPLSGNPLAVVEDADDLSLDQMQRIAGEFNQAETTS